MELRIPYDEIRLFEANRIDNQTKYRDTNQLSKVRRHAMTLGTINIGCLGSWDTHNDIELKIIGLNPKQTDKLSQLLIASVTHESYHESYIKSY